MTSATDDRSIFEIGESIAALAADPASESLAAGERSRESVLERLRADLDKAREAYYRAAAAVYESEGNTEHADWNRALASGDYDAAHVFYVRHQARRWLAHEPLDRNMSDADFSAVLCEAERMQEGK